MIVLNGREDLATPATFCGFNHIIEITYFVSIFVPLHSNNVAAIMFSNQKDKQVCHSFNC